MIKGGFKDKSTKIGKIKLFIWLMTWLLDYMFFWLFSTNEFQINKCQWFAFTRVCTKQWRKLSIDENENSFSKDNNCTFLQICRPKNKKLQAY